MVDYGTFNIDQYHQGTMDKSYYGGHYYSNKAIGLPLLGVPAYWVLRTITPLKKLPPLNGIERYLLRILTTTLPFSVLGLLLFRIALLLGADYWKALLVVMAYCLGSIGLIHAIIFSGHQTAASFAFFSFYIIYTLQRDGMLKQAQDFKSRGLFFVAGFFAGIGALCDYTAIFIAIVLSLYLLSLPISVGNKISFLLGGFVCAAVLLLYNWHNFGGPLSFSYGHLSQDEFREGASEGLLGIALPKLDAIIGIFISPSRGLFFIMPIFLFSIIGLSRMWNDKALRRETILIAVIIAGYFLINAGFYGWHGGWTFGPRYLTPALPFLTIPLIFAPLRSKLFLIVLGLSILQVGMAVVSFPHIPQEIRNPIIEFLIPLMRYGYFAHNIGMLAGLKDMWSLLPIIILVLLLIIFAKRKLPNNSAKEPLSRFWNIFLIAWSVLIILGICTQHTVPLKIVHLYRAQILYDAFHVSGDEELKKFAVLENELAR